MNIFIAAGMADERNKVIDAVHATDSETEKVIVPPWPKATQLESWKMTIRRPAQT